MNQISSSTSHPTTGALLMLTASLAFAGTNVLQSYLAWPVGVLLGYLVVMLALSSRQPGGGGERPGQRSAEPALQD